MKHWNTLVFQLPFERFRGETKSRHQLVKRGTSLRYGVDAALDPEDHVTPQRDLQGQEEEWFLHPFYGHSRPRGICQEFSEQGGGAWLSSS